MLQCSVLPVDSGTWDNPKHFGTCPMECPWAGQDSQTWLLWWDEVYWSIRYFFRNRTNVSCVSWRCPRDIASGPQAFGIAWQLIENLHEAKEAENLHEAKVPGLVDLQFFPFRTKIRRSSFTRSSFRSSTTCIGGSHEGKLYESLLFVHLHELSYNGGASKQLPAIGILEMNSYEHHIVGQSCSDSVLCTCGQTIWLAVTSPTQLVTWTFCGAFLANISPFFSNYIN